MKLLVCIKQVMESGAEIKIDPEGDRILQTKHTRFEMNPYDEYAVEEAIQIKEKHEDVRIDVISVGPERIEEALRRTLGMGADEAIRIRDEKDGYRPPLVTASRIAEYAADKDYDLILTGIMSEDEMNAQTGPMIAQIMGLPCATAVIRTDISEDDRQIDVEREIEGGSKDCFKISLPCVLTIQTGINSPRYPSLSKVMRARKKDIETVPSPDSDVLAGRTELDCLREPQKTARGITLEGSIEEKAGQLLDILISRSLA